MAIKKVFCIAFSSPPCSIHFMIVRYCSKWQLSDQIISTAVAAIKFQSASLFVPDIVLDTARNSKKEQVWSWETGDLALGAYPISQP